MILHSDTGVSVVSGTYERNGRKIWRNDYGRKKNFDTTVRQQDLDALGQYKTADVDRLIRRYVKEQADAAPLREHILTEQQFHRNLLLCKLTAN